MNKQTVNELQWNLNSALNALEEAMAANSPTVAETKQLEAYRQIRIATDLLDSDSE